MNDPNNIKRLLISNYNSCKKQANSLVEAWNDLKPLIPLAEDDIENLTKETRYIVDSLTLCFGRLQDMLGSKVFKTILKLEVEEFVTMADILNKMEKMQIIENVEEWKRIREARNEIFHEYKDNYEETANNLNFIISYIPKLLKIIDLVGKYINNNVLDK